MDNVTHTLTGLMLSRAGLNKLVPRASALLMIAANIPDIDVVSLLWGADVYLHHHRGITHALAAIPFMAMLPVLLVRIFGRAPLPWLRSWLVCLIGVATHPLLDWTNMYGIRLLLPFRPDWLALDSTNVVDLWIWGALILAVSAPAVSRLVSSEIGGKRTAGRGWAIAALLFVVCYDTTRVVLHKRAVEVQDGRMFADATPRKVAAFPDGSRLFRWRGLVETEGFFVTTPVDLTGEFDPGAGRVIYKPENTAAMDAVRSSAAFSDLAAFSRFVLWRATPEPEPQGTVRVEALDLRFGEPSAPRFYATAIVNERSQVERAWFQF